jgi:tetratricopeptide (TPR) repeat protein
MAERREDATETDDVAGVASAPSPDPGLAAGVGLAFGRTSKGNKALDEDARIFLREQTDLLRLQKEHLHEQRLLILSRLRLGRWKDWVTLTLQLLTVLVGVIVAAALGVMAWQAHRDHGVVIEAFSVPPDLAQRGLTGQVVASELLDRLSSLQGQTVTARPASSYASDWGDDIKVEIPETGVSIGELNRYLRQWLGSQTRITGAVVRTASGLAVTARAGASSGRRFAGAEADLDKLVGQAAEALYAQTQPYRYAVWLSTQGRQGEALALYARLARSGPPEDRAWAYAGWATLLREEGRSRDAVRMAEAAIRIDPTLYPPHDVLGESLDRIGRTEDALAEVSRNVALLESRRFVGLPPAEVANRLRLERGLKAQEAGDSRTSIALLKGVGPNIAFEGQSQAFNPDLVLARSLALDHDVSASRQVTSRETGRPERRTGYAQAAALEDWASMAPGIESALSAPGQGDARLTVTAPQVATIYAHLGRFAEAEALLAETPMDCYRCLRARGQVAALKHDWPAADRWFAEAARQAPSLPQADTDWGEALLVKGDLDGAIAKLKEAHRRSPHYADALEVWGEVLIAKRDDAGAIARFAEADKYAPRWGRNHLRWGEALMLSGRYAEARRQYEAANGLDISKPDRAALNVLLDRTAKGPLHG